MPRITLGAPNYPNRSKWNLVQMRSLEHGVPTNLRASTTEGSLTKDTTSLGHVRLTVRLLVLKYPNRWPKRAHPELAGRLPPSKGL